MDVVHCEGGREGERREVQLLTTDESFLQMNLGILHSVGIRHGRRRQRSSHVVYNQPIKKQHAHKRIDTGLVHTKLVHTYNILLLG